MMTKTQGRPADLRLYPLAPLLAKTGSGRHDLMVLVKANGSAVKRAAEEGCTEAEADRWSCRLGLHPAEVWGDLWFDRDHPSMGQVTRPKGARP